MCGRVRFSPGIDRGAEKNYNAPEPGISTRGIEQPMTNVDSEALAAKADETLLSSFIAENRRFILSCASRTARRFVTESDDEWSAALVGFGEAVRDYDGSRGPFRTFAALVIRRSVLDYLETESRHQPEISVEPYSMDGETEDVGEPEPIQLEIARRTAETAAQNEAESAADEIAAVQDILGCYGFSFFELADCSPKAEKTKLGCARAVNAIVSTPGLMDRMRDTKNLPAKEIRQLTAVPLKLLDRHRKYIIAAAEILYGEYPKLAEYLAYVRKARETK